MNTEWSSALRGEKLNAWKSLLERCGLQPDLSIDKTILVFDSGALVASGSRKGNLLKCIAVDASRTGEGLTATVLSALRQDAFGEGIKHLFLYTKPENKAVFSSLFFYPIAQSDRVLLMENQKNGICEFLSSLPPPPAESKTVGAAVMNCNPFTLGHRHLIETAARECDHLYIFVLSEDQSFFSASDRMEMVKRGTADLKNITVLPTGPYLISSATFPTYFLKDRESATEVQCLLDIEIFAGLLAPALSITRRYVGSEPLSPLTSQYNETLRRCLPKYGIEYRDLPRLERNGEPISASRVRALLKEGKREAVRALVPKTTFEHLRALGLL